MLTWIASLPLQPRYHVPKIMRQAKFSSHHTLWHPIRMVIGIAGSRPMVTWLQRSLKRSLIYPLQCILHPDGSVQCHTITEPHDQILEWETQYKYKLNCCTKQQFREVIFQSSTSHSGISDGHFNLHSRLNADGCLVILVKKTLIATDQVVIITIGSHKCH